MAKNVAADIIMAGDKMKPLLALSKKEPLQAAIGLTSDGEGVILLDKKAKPRAMMGLLKARAAKAQIKLNPSSVRFGRAEVDVEYDPGMVRFFVNKDAPGVMRVKLIEVVKPISFQKVEINVDPSLEEEPEEGAAGEQEAVAAAPVPAPAPVLDAGALLAELRGLVARVAGAAGGDAGRQAKLAQLGSAAGTALKAGQAQAAADAIGQLRAALDAAPRPAAAAAAAGPAAGAVGYGKARLTWVATRKKVLADVEALTGLVRADYEDEGFAEAIAKQFNARVAPILARFDERLGDRLDEAGNETDPEKRRALVQQARGIVGEYQAYLASEPLIAALDDNPYKPLAIAATLGQTLTALSGVIR